jgi:hypothetical protein
MTRVDCPFCGMLGRVSAERVIQSSDALTIYFCDECHAEWDQRDNDPTPLNRRTRQSKTHRDKTS